MENLDLHAAKSPHTFLHGTGAKDAGSPILFDRRTSAMSASMPAGQPIKAPSRTALPIGSPWLFGGGGGGGSDSGK